MAKTQNKTITAAKLAELIGAELSGDGSVVIRGVNTIAAAGGEELTFLSSEKALSELRESSAGAVIVKERVEGVGAVQLVAGNVDEALIKALRYFADEVAFEPGVHATAEIDGSANIDENVYIGPGVCIGPGADIAGGVHIGPNCCIGRDTTIGAGTVLDANVTVYHGCSIGSKCVIQASSVIGSVGFGYSFIDNSHQLIPHTGGVVIEDCVDIAACVCIDRAKFGNTVIGAGTKIDNLVHIAHNVKVGRLCLIAGQVGIAGSTEIGDGSVFGGQAGMADNIKIGTRVMCGAQAGIMSNIEDGAKIVGSPAKDVRAAMKEFAAVARLPELIKQVKQLNKRVSELEGAKDN